SYDSSLESESESDDEDDDNDGPPVPLPPTDVIGIALPPRSVSWESPTRADIHSGTFIYHAIAGMRLAPHYRRPMVPDAYHHPSVHRKLQYQRVHDERTLGAPASTVQLIVRRDLLDRPASHTARAWWRIQRAVSDIIEDKQPYHKLIYTETLLGRYNAYRHSWDCAVEPRPVPLLRFADIPWPVHSGRALIVDHITPGQVFRFLVRVDTRRPLEWAAVRRLELEMGRWLKKTVEEHLLPRVAEYDRDSVRRAAVRVVNHMWVIRKELLEYFAGLGNPRAKFKLDRLLEKITKKEA
ncbi:hypothetical protein C8F01DRAFT_1151458, partial [Mycena amicta]